MTNFIVNNRTDPWKTDVNLFLTTTNCYIVGSRSLTSRIEYKFIYLFAWQWKLANERARIYKYAVLVKKDFISYAFLTNKCTFKAFSKGLKDTLRRHFHPVYFMHSHDQFDIQLTYLSFWIIYCRKREGTYSGQRRGDIIEAIITHVT